MPSNPDNNIPPMPPGPPRLGTRTCKYRNGQCIWANSNVATNENKRHCNQSNAQAGKCSAPREGGRRKTRKQCRRKTRSRK